MENKELIVVKQLPIIEEKLQEISKEIDKKVETANKLVCTEETVKEVKKVRTEIGKQFKELETQRKNVKTQVMKPYNDFEEIYKKYISNKFKEADNTLKVKIDIVENELKENKNNEIKDYFIEYAISKELAWLEDYYPNANINITLSASMKSLKEQAKSFIDKVIDAISLINTQKHTDEILIEFMKDLNASRAIKEVQDRYTQLNDLKEQKAEEKEYEAVSQEMVSKVESLSTPTVEKAEEILETTFKVRGTNEQLLKLKEFLDNGGYDYE